MMRNIVALFVLLIASLSYDAKACSPTANYVASVDAAVSHAQMVMDKADVVFIGTVKDIGTVKEADTGQGFSPITFDVRAIWKGAEAMEITIGNLQDKQCGTRQYQIGQLWLVTANKKNDQLFTHVFSAGAFLLPADYQKITEAFGKPSKEFN